MKKIAIFLIASLFTVTFFLVAKSTTPTQKSAVQTKKSNTERFLLGEFDLNKVVDGDTLSVKGLGGSIRILFIDTEETKKGKKAFSYTKEIADNWDEILEEKIEAAKEKGKPVKFNTPNGYQAMVWAKGFVEDADSDLIRLEYDNPDATRGFYNRHLAYVFVKKDGKWINFNIEAVRAGYSPYTSKYGRSIRFHKEFLAAQVEARKYKRGIWNPNGKHYPDYDMRLKWWNKRGDQIHTYRQKHQKEYVFVGGSSTAYGFLKKSINKKVKLFGLLASLKSDGQDATFKMPIKQFRDIIVNVKASAKWSYDDLKKMSDYYIYLTGTLKRNDDGKMELDVTKHEQIEVR